MWASPMRKGTSMQTPMHEQFVFDVSAPWTHGLGRRAQGVSNLQHHPIAENVKASLGKMVKDRNASDNVHGNMKTNDAHMRTTCIGILHLSLQTVDPRPRAWFR
jgi:hypothetical protein